MALSERDIMLLRLFAESVYITWDHETYSISCNWCTGHTGRWGDGVALEDVVGPAVEHLTYFHPEKLQPFAPVTDEEIAEVFGLVGSQDGEENLRRT